MSADISGQNCSMNSLRLLSAWSLRVGCFSFSIFSNPIAVLGTGGLRPAVGLRETSTSVDKLGSFLLFFLDLPFLKSMCNCRTITRLCAQNQPLDTTPDQAASAFWILPTLSTWEPFVARAHSVFVQILRCIGTPHLTLSLCSRRTHQIPNGILHMHRIRGLHVGGDYKLQILSLSIRRRPFLVHPRHETLQGAEVLSPEERGMEKSSVVIVHD